MTLDERMAAWAGLREAGTPGEVALHAAE